MIPSKLLSFCSTASSTALKAPAEDLFPKAFRMQIILRGQTCGSSKHNRFSHSSHSCHSHCHDVSCSARNADCLRCFPVCPAYNRLLPSRDQLILLSRVVVQRLVSLIPLLIFILLIHREIHLHELLIIHRVQVVLQPADLPLSSLSSIMPSRPSYP